MLDRLWALTGGLDGAEKRALPIGEFLHPVALFGVVILALNDHLLKGSGYLPGWLTGKLSDFAGLAFFPLLLTALLDCGLLLASRFGARIDFSLRWSKLLPAIAMTGGVFAAIKLSASAAELVAELLSAVGWPSVIVVDPTDLIALTALAVPLLIGRAELRRVPLGRLEVILRSDASSPEEIEGLLSDVGSGESVRELAAAIAEHKRSSAPELLNNTLGKFRFEQLDQRKRASDPRID